MAEVINTIAHPQRRPWWRRWRTWLLAGAALLLFGLLLSIWMVYRTPDWYRPIRADDPNVDIFASKAQASLGQLQNNWRNAIVKETTWTITQNELNSLIAVNGEEIRRLTPRYGVEDPMVSFSPDTVTFSTRMQQIPGQGGRGGIVSLVVTLKTIPPRNAETGAKLQVAVRGVWIGSLPLPQWAVRQQLDSMWPSLLAGVQQAMTDPSNPQKNQNDHAVIVEALEHARRGEAFVPTDPRTGRRYPLRNIQVSDGKFTVHLGPVEPPPSR